MKQYITEGPLVSVVMCCYNAEEFVAEAIESILRQDYPNFEFIIWNDGSKDKTESIIKSYDDERIRYFYHENLGVGGAANMACAEARGKYIARIDSDDIAFPQRIRKEVEYMERHPHCVLLSAAVSYIDRNGKLISRSYPYTWNTVLKKSMKKMSNPFSHSACLFRRDAFLKVNYPNTRCFEDAIMFRRLSRLGDVANLGETLIKYRLLPGSVSHSLGYYMPLMRVAEKLVEDSTPDQIKINEQLFDYIYMYAKKYSDNQVKGYYNNSFSAISHIVQSFPDNDMLTKLVIFIHNIIGFVRYR